MRLPLVNWLALSLAAVPLVAAPPPQRNFVACPILRDTQTVPCWLAEYEGELYFLGLQPQDGSSWRPPLLGHRVLVEGVISDAYRICGGVVLRPVVTSVLPDLDSACSTSVLPAVEQYTVPFAGTPTENHSSDSDDIPPVILDFEFDSMRLTGRNVAAMERALEWAKGIQGTVEIVGGRGATLLSNGSVLVEAPGIAARRIAAIVELFTSTGIRRERIVARPSDMPAVADGVNDHESRRVVIRPSR